MAIKINKNELINQQNESMYNFMFGLYLQFSAICVGYHLVNPKTMTVQYTQKNGQITKQNYDSVDTAIRYGPPGFIFLWYFFMKPPEAKRCLITIYPKDKPNVNCASYDFDL